ncbi:MAG: PHP domain-containing protein, partial [Pseudohongiellaceae bacterium]
MSSPTNLQHFTHLRIHTEYSISDGLVRVSALIARLRELHMPAAAITDLANLFALIKFYSGAQQAGIKPVCGCDVWVENDAGQRTPLVLLVQNEAGYLNLTTLISEIYTRSGGVADPVIRQADLTGRTEGLLALSGAQHGDIGAALLSAEFDLAEELLQTWMELFPGRFYLELQRVGKRDEEAYIAAAVRLALKLQCPVVATNDVRFVAQDDFDAHEVRVCINERRTLDDPRRPHNYTDQQYLKSAEEMQALFADIPEAISNAMEIARRCNLHLTL